MGHPYPNQQKMPLLFVRLAEPIRLPNEATLTTSDIGPRMTFAGAANGSTLVHCPRYRPAAPRRRAPAGWPTRGARHDNLVTVDLLDAAQRVVEPAPGVAETQHRAVARAARGSDGSLGRPGDELNSRRLGVVRRAVRDHNHGAGSTGGPFHHHSQRGAAGNRPNAAAASAVRLSRHAVVRAKSVVQHARRQRSIRPRVAGGVDGGDVAGYKSLRTGLDEPHPDLRQHNHGSTS